ncbi:MAG: FG-GAP repeat protein [Ignavibacteria bacterium]|nr:FG-GAP repeat protein [Ignavibacteria bacterium]
MKKYFFKFFPVFSSIPIVILLSVFTSTAFSQQKNNSVIPEGFTKEQILGFIDGNGMSIFQPDDTTSDAYQTRNFTGFNTGDSYGNSVSSAGDVNGDGYDDIIIGAPYNDGIAVNAGRAYIYYGGLNVNTIADITLSGESAMNYFGFSVSSAGDVNGDGYSDVIVGAFAYSNKGRAYIFLGGAGMNNSADVIMTGDTASYFGYSVASAGDVNSDGYCDVIVGANAYNSQTGGAYIFYGGSGMNNIADVTMTGEAVNNNFGYSVSSAGDVNGDGYCDVIVGAYGYNFFTGKAYVFYGSASMNNTADLTITGESANMYLGWSVSTAGDVNGDGYDDIIVPSPTYNSSMGKAGIYFGGATMNNTADVILTGPATNYQFGVSVASAGDVNGDGYCDVIVGSDLYSSFTGRAFIFYGGSVMNSTPDFIMTGEGVNNRFSFSAASAGDVNGDGYSDIIVGAYGYSSNTGKAYLYMYGMNGNLYSDLLMTGETISNLFGYSVASAGDVNSDGYCDLIIGAPGYSTNTGRAYIFYGGSDMNNVADVTITGDGPNISFGWSVASAGDVNGDGYCDVIIGAYAYSSYTGKAGIYYGGVSMNNVVDVLMIGPAVNYSFGYSVASAGDVNGDGYCDVIVGANDYNTSMGRAYLFYGGSSMNNTADVTMTGEAVSNNFGASVAPAGDVNGDGFSDVLIGAWSYSSNTGRAYIFYGGAVMDNTADVTMTGETSGIKYGVSVASAGDVNGDSYSDVIIGASLFSSNTGRAYLYYGGSNMNNTSDVIMTGETSQNYFGISVSPAGDMNKDGYSDIIVGAHGYNNSTGRVYLFFGGAAMNNIADVTMTGEAANIYYGISVSSAGDVNCDGSADLIAGAAYYNSNTGRSYVYLNSSPGVIPALISVNDVPDDQGGYVNVRWARSAYDLNINGLVTNYVIERSAITDMYGLNWVVAGTVPAIHNTVYNYEARTASDSGSSGNAMFSFRVSAFTNTPGETWRSNIRNGYSVDNLSPLPPQNLTGMLLVNVVRLDWNANAENDLRQYIVYRNGIKIGVSGTLFFNDNAIMPDSTYVYTIAAEDIHGNIGSLSNEAVITYTVSNIYISIIPEGYYNASSKLLNMKDTVKAYLHFNVTPYNVIDSAVSVIDSVSYIGSFKFFNAPNGNYYIVIKHRNTIETWSRSGGEQFVSGTVMNYDFTSSSTQAYGSNMIQVDTSPVRFAIYSGDINQDGTIDASDLSETDNDAFNSVSGYVRTDVTGDDFVDAGDVSIVDNNAYNSVSVVLP